MQILKRKQQTTKTYLKAVSPVVTFICWYAHIHTDLFVDTPSHENKYFLVKRIYFMDFYRFKDSNIFKQYNFDAASHEDKN